MASTSTRMVHHVSTIPTLALSKSGIGSCQKHLSAVISSPCLVFCCERGRFPPTVLKYSMHITDMQGYFSSIQSFYRQFVSISAIPETMRRMITILFTIFSLIFPALSIPAPRPISINGDRIRALFKDSMVMIP